MINPFILEIVTENSKFDIENFIPVLRERMFTKERYLFLCCEATLEPPTAGAGDDIEPWLQSERGFNGRGNQVRLDVCEKVEKDREK